MNENARKWIKMQDLAARLQGVRAGPTFGLQTSTSRMPRTELYRLVPAFKAGLREPPWPGSGSPGCPTAPPLPG